MSTLFTSYLFNECNETAVIKVLLKQKFHMYAGTHLTIGHPPVPGANSRALSLSLYPAKWAGWTSNGPACKAEL